MLASCSTPSQKLKLIEFQNKLCKVVLDDQTKKEEENSAAAVLDQVLLLNDADMVYILDNIWENITHKRYAKLFSLFESLSVDEHCEFFTLVGSEVFNKSIYKTSVELTDQVSSMGFEELSKIPKASILEKCDIRLLALIKASIKKLGRMAHHDATNEICNIIDNFCKARNAKCLIPGAMREGEVCYVSSGKSNHTSQVVSKQGCKGTKHVLERVITNTVQNAKFIPPERVTMYFSYDNIQQFLKSSRITSSDDYKILAIIIASILMHQPDGDKKDDIQYKKNLSPCSWFSEYKYNETNGVSIDNLNPNSIQKVAKVSKEDENIVDAYMARDLVEAMVIVDEELNSETGKDVIDYHVKEDFRKSRKICGNNHILENPNPNRKYCDRPNCKAVLKVNESVPQYNLTPVYSNTKDHVKSLEEKRADHYMRVPNIFNEQKVKEVALGAVC